VPTKVIIALLLGKVDTPNTHAFYAYGKIVEMHLITNKKYDLSILVSPLVVTTLKSL
jgi:hypothetical protein